MIKIEPILLKYRFKLLILCQYLSSSINIINIKYRRTLVNIMEQERKKFFPGEAAISAPKAAVKTGKSSFQARKIPDFHQGTPANDGISIKKQFDTYIDDKYSNITIEQRQILWTNVSEKMLIESSENLYLVIDSYFSYED